MPTTMMNTEPLTAPPLPPAAPSRRRFLAPAIVLAVLSAALAGGLLLYDYQSDQRDQRVAELRDAMSGDTPTTLCYSDCAPTVTYIAAGSAAIVTSSEYQQIEEGMTYEEVVRIIDTAGTELSSSDIGNISTVMYGWVNDDGSNMNAMFQGGRLVLKAQFGL